MLKANWESLLSTSPSFSSYFHSLSLPAVFQCCQIHLFSPVAILVVEALLLITWVSCTMAVSERFCSRRLI